MKLLLLGYNANYKTDDVFWDKAEEIPGGYIIQREIVNAVNGKKFFYNNENGKPVFCDAVQWDEFYYYYQIWEDFHVLRVLPHGEGTLAERRWLLDLLKIFERTYNATEALIEEKMAKKMQQGMSQWQKYH